MSSNGTDPESIIAVAGINFNSQYFGLFFAEYGIPMIVTVAVGILLLKPAKFSLLRIPSWIATWSFLANWPHFGLWQWVFGVPIYMALAGPFVFLLLWGIMTCVWIPPVVIGVTVLLIGFVLLLGAYTVLLWRSNAYRTTRPVYVFGLMTMVFFVAYEIAVTFLIQPYVYEGMTAIFLAFNLCPIIVMLGLYQNKQLVFFDELAKLGDDSAAVFGPRLSGELDRKRLGVYIACIAISLGFLIAYAVLVMLTSRTRTTLGWVTAGAVLVMDLTVLAMHSVDLVSSPTVIALLCLACRVCLFAVGPRYWFYGHMAVYVLFGVLLAYIIADRRVPDRDALSDVREALGTDPVNALLRVQEDPVYASRVLAATTVDEVEKVRAEAAPAATAMGRLAQGAAQASSVLRVVVKQPETLLIATTLAFVTDLIVVHAISAADLLPGGQSQPVTAIAGIIFVAMVLALFIALRLYAYFNFEMNWKIVLAGAVCEAAIVGEAVFLYFMTLGNTIPLAVGIFLPVIVLAVVMCWGLWRKNDYDCLTLKPDPLPADAGPFKRAILSRLPVRDLLMLGGLTALILALLGLSLTIALTYTPSFVGWTIGAWLAIPLATLVPVIRWFQTFSLTVFSVGAGIAAIVMLVLYCVLMYVQTFAASVSGGSLAMLFVLLVYPTVVVGGVALYKLRDDAWQLSRPVLAMGVVCGALLLAFGVAVAVLAQPFVIGLALILALVYIGYGVCLVYVSVQNRDFLPLPWRVSALVLVVVAVGLGIGVGFVALPFFGFSIAWGAVFVSVVGLALRYYHGSQRVVLMYSRFVFPVYRYYPAQDLVARENYGPFLIYTGLMMAHAWAILATIFLAPVYLGLGLSALFIVFLFTLTGHYLIAPAKRLGELSLHLTPEVIEEARKRAHNRVGARAALSGSTSVLVAQLGFGGQSPRGAAAGPRDDDDDVEEVVAGAGVGGADAAAAAAAAAPSSPSGSTLPVPPAAAAGAAGADGESARTASEVSVRVGDTEGLNSFHAARDERDRIVRSVRVFLSCLPSPTETASVAPAAAAGAAGAAEPPPPPLARAMSVGAVDAKDRVAVGALMTDGTRREKLALLLALDGRVARAWNHYTRFRAYFYAMTVIGAEARREQSRTLFKAFVRDKFPGITIEQIAGWTTEQWAKYKTELAAWLASRAAEELRQAENDRKQQEADEQRRKAIAEAERQRHEAERKRLEEEERKRIGDGQVSEEDLRKRINERLKTRPEWTLDDGTPVDKLLESPTPSKLFEDEQFPATAKSLYFTGTPRPGAMPIDKWLRPADFAGPGAEPVLFLDKIEPADIRQGGLGDCWFLSAVAVLARQEDAVRRLFHARSADLLRRGMLAVRFNVEGLWRTIIIDTRFPALASGAIAYAHSEKPTELWVMALEKAYAKLHGAYDNLIGGLVHVALVDLTGGFGEEIPLNNETKRNPQVLFEKLLSYHQAGYMMGAGSHPGSDAAPDEGGIVPGHAYSILDVQLVDDLQFIKLRNPWGNTEWNGDWSDESGLWTRRMRTKLGMMEAKDDGEFWMVLPDLLENYRSIYVCKTLNEEKWIKTRIEGEWKGKSAGGAPNPGSEDRTIGNPQFHLTVTRPTRLLLQLQQDDPRLAGRDPFEIGALICDKKGKRVKTLFAGELVASSLPYQNRRNVSIDTTLQPSQSGGPYTLMVSTFKPGQECEFVLTMWTDVPMTVAPIPENAPAS